jgi:hypothetical protein
MCEGDQRRDERPAAETGHQRSLAPLPGGVRGITGDVFQVPVGPAGGFEAIVAALTRKLATTAVPTHIGMVALYPVDHPGRYTQCLLDVEDGAWVECVSNEFLAPHDRLSPEDEKLLVEVGYQEPDDLHPNFWMIQDPPVDWPMVANLLVAPFGTIWPCQPYGIMELVVDPHFRESCSCEENDEDH